MEFQIFTFSSCQTTADGTPLNRRFVRIQGSREHAAAEMRKARGGKWAHQYDERQGAAAIERGGLRGISLYEVTLSKNLIES